METLYSPFQQPFSRWTWISQHQNVSILDFIAAKDDGGGSDNWSYKKCKAPVKLSPPTNQHCAFFPCDAMHKRGNFVTAVALKKPGSCLYQRVDKQEAQLMLTNPRDVFRGQSRSPNIVPLHMLGICLLRNSNFVFKMHRFSDIRLQSGIDVTLKSGSKVIQGHREWYHSIDCVWFPISVLR